MERCEKEDRMQFIVHGYDGEDKGALDRRLAARDAHLANAKAWTEKGNLLFATALLDDSGNMVGSVVVCDFSSKEALQTEWLDKEPYVTGDVWLGP